MLYKAICKVNMLIFLIFIYIGHGHTIVYIVQTNFQNIVHFTAHCYVF